MGLERITYLVANYNHARYLGDCLGSLVAQTSPEWLAIVGDDASSDGSLSVIGSFSGSRIRVLVNERRLGYTTTLERLIAAAETDIVAILDADDALSETATERLLAAYAEHPVAGFVYSRYALFDQRLEVCRGTHGTPLGAAETALRDGVVGAIRSFRRSVYRRTAGLDPALPFAEDRDPVYKLEEVTRPVFVDAPLYRYREVPGSQSRAPAMREEGARNTLRARRAAARRRGMRGAERVFSEAFFLADYLAYSERPPGLIRAAANQFARVMRRLAKLFAQPLIR